MPRQIKRSKFDREPGRENGAQRENGVSARAQQQQERKRERERERERESKSETEGAGESETGEGERARDTLRDKPSERRVRSQRHVLTCIHI